MLNKLTLNDSSFAMWRGIVALAYVDHKLTADEINFFKTKFAELKLAPAQQEIIDRDLANGVKLADVYHAITEPSHRTNLLNMGYVIFHRDGDYSNVEKSFYDEIYAKHMQSIDAKKLSTKTKDAAEKDLGKWTKHSGYKEDLPGLGDDFQDFMSWLF